jgi:hypothetical protein
MKTRHVHLRIRWIPVLVLALFLSTACETDEGEGGGNADVSSSADVSADVSADTIEAPDGSETSADTQPEETADTGDTQETAEETEPECQTDDDCTAMMGAPAPWVCTSIFCDAASGTCYDGPLPDGTSCQPQDACKIDGACTAGLCDGSAIDCDDDDPCTEDTCDPVTGCSYGEVHPDCGDLECGENACGYFCGTCPDKTTCEEGICIPTYPCADFEQPGCTQDGCDEGFTCDTSVGCVPSACSCDPETGDTICTADCGGGTCVPDGGDPCADFKQPGCIDAGCDDGFVCGPSIGCVPSACSCDPETGTTICTADCSGGTCVPEATDSLVTGGGSSFGMCGGACKTDLSLIGAAAKVVTSGWDDTIYTTNSGLLSAAALAKSANLAQALLDAELQGVYGCPDCADGGEAFVDLLRAGVASHHAYEFNNPPNALGGANTFIFEIIQSLLSCTASDYVTPDGACVAVQ